MASVAQTELALDLEQVNRDLGGDAPGLVRWALSLGKPTIVTSNFRPFAAVMLHLVTRVRADIPVIWMDSGYNTAETYQHAEALRTQLGLDLRIYMPRRTRAHREALEGPPPATDDPRHEAFVEEIKLEPFARALREHDTAVWLHGARAEDTAHRAQMQPVSINEAGVIKVAPLLAWSSRELHEYLKQHGLPNNWDYFDPTKPDPKSECGLLTTN